MQPAVVSGAAEYIPRRDPFRGMLAARPVCLVSGYPMRGEVRSIEANDIPDWENWRPAQVADECQWFTVTVRKPGSNGGDLFQVCIASVAWLRHVRQGPFVGLSVERFNAESVTQAVRGHVASVEAPTWEQCAQALAPQMKWECVRMTIMG